MRRPETFLGDYSVDEFLAEYWQRRPLLCRGALPGYDSPVSRESMLALAMNEDVESRLVVHAFDTWHLEPGPFEPDRWQALGDRDWTLLLQDLEVHVPSTHEVLDLLGFLPAFRVDDLMASYAVPGGSVGPHFDHYDVFLLQVSGQRRWQITSHFDRSALREDTDLCVLREFVPEAEWVLGPGDMLYLPPGVAHFGVALDPCITFSLGCRAPSAADLIAQLAANAVDEADEGTRYTDPGLGSAEAEGGLSNAAILRVQRLLEQHLRLDRHSVLTAFGQVVTQPKALFAEVDPGASSPATRSIPVGYRRARGSRWLYQDAGGEGWLFVNGQVFRVAAETREVAQRLAAERRVTAETAAQWGRQAAAAALLESLVEVGLLLPDPSP